MFTFFICDVFRLTAFGDGDSLLARWGKMGDAKGAGDWGSAGNA